MTLRGAGVEGTEEEEHSEEEDLPYGKGAFGEEEKGSDGESTRSAADSPRSGSGSPSPADFSSGSDDEVRAGAAAPHALKLQPGCLGEAWGEEPGSGLVDLDPAEGRRRGKELLALLLERAPSSESAESGAGKAGTSPPSLPRLPLRPPAAPEKAGGAAADAFSGACSPPSSACWASPAAVASSIFCGQHFCGVSEAASRVFGSDLAEVAPRSSGCALLLRGFAGWELRRGGRAQLDAFACALWPLLAPEAVSMQSKPASEAGSSAWLSLWCLDRTASCAQRICWDYVRRGACPRIGRCRWLHAAPPTYCISIELKPIC